jgi:hypothetical protein
VSTNINSLAPPFQPRQLIPWGSMPRNLYKQRAFSQSPVPPGYRLTKKHQKVPTDHQSYKPMQDALNESMLREIRNTEPGKRRDYLIAKWEAWVANGMPTWGSPGKNADKNEWHKTQAKGSGVWQDEVEDQHPRQKRRYNLADLYPEYAEG